MGNKPIFLRIGRGSSLSCQNPDIRHRISVTRGNHRIHIHFNDLRMFDNELRDSQEQALQAFNISLFSGSSIK
jgi:hypothetical protein